MRQPKEIITDCLSEESIARVVKQNPNITVAAVYKKCERLTKTGKAIESIRSEFTQAIANLLGNDSPVKANGSRVFEGKESVQLTIFDL